MNRTQLLTLIATGLGLFMIFLDALIVNVALPDIQRSFAVGEDGLQWVVASYSLGMAVFIMSAATLADLDGRRRWYLIGVSLFTLGSIACGLAPSIAVLTTARGAQGLGAAAVSVTSLALVSAAFPEAKEKARAIGIWTAIASIGTTTGPTLGGLLVDQWGWRSIFYVNLPMGALVLFLTLCYVEESCNERARRFDLSGQLLFIVAVGALVYAVIEGPQIGWTSVQTIVMLWTAAVGCALFVWLERRSSNPMMDLTLFRDTSYALAMASGIMSAQRAIGSTIGFAVLGSVLAAWLSATLEPHLERAVPDPVQRHVLAEIIIDSANPRAHVGGIVPRRHIEHRDPVAIAEEDFIEGIRVALLVATATLAVVFLAGWRWFPRDVHTAGSDLSERLPTAMTVECAVSHMPGATWCRLWPA